MYIANSYPNGRVPDFDIAKIGKIIETEVDGTFPDNILNLNKVGEVLSAIPSIEFELHLSWHTLDELIEEINEEQPPIAFVSLSDEQRIHKCTHAVVITKVDNTHIYFNDPIFGELSEDINSFLSRWDDADRILVKVKIGKTKQRMLEEFAKQ